MASWIDEEVKASEFKDKRLTERFRSILSTLAAGNGQTIPQLCEDWAMTKATYRFLSNDRVEENEILSGHFHQVSKRVKATKGPVLILHDTSEFVYKREDVDAIGLTRRGYIPGKFEDGLKKEYSACGVLMHASLAVTSEGLPLGLTSARFWTRNVFKNTAQLKRQVNSTRIPVDEKESIKWLQNLQFSNKNLTSDPSKFVHIGDRECDIYEFYSECVKLNTFFLIRSSANRLADDTTIAEIVDRSNKPYIHKINFIDGNGVNIEAKLSVKVKKVMLHPPQGKVKNYPDVEAFVIAVSEVNPPDGRQAIRWNFITNLPITNRKQAIQAIEWYKQRWKIETFFKIMKSGFKAEESKLRTADRISRLLSIICILAWRVHWITHLTREGQSINPHVAFDAIEIKILASIYKKTGDLVTLHDYVVILARLGGYLARRSDPPPGNTVIWRGLSKLNDLKFGFEMRCG